MKAIKEIGFTENIKLKDLIMSAHKHITVTLRNNFHNTECNVRIPEATRKISGGQIRRARKKLCGISDCCCAMDSAGCRPAQIEEFCKNEGFVI